MSRCGNCTLCCKLPKLYDVGITKPANTWCQHCDIGKGCRIYAERPQSCRDFACFWLVNTWLPDELRPDRSNVVLEAPADVPIVIAMVDPDFPDAWTREPMRSLLQWIVQTQGRTVIVMGDGGAKQALVPEGVNPEDLLSQVEALIRSQAAELAPRMGKTPDEMFQQMVGGT